MTYLAFADPLVWKRGRLFRRSADSGCIFVSHGFSTTEMRRRDDARLELEEMTMPNAKDQCQRVSQAEALYRWCRFTDAAIGGAGQPIEARMDRLASAGATEARLKALWLEVRHMNWADVFGQSPWVTAATLGAALEARDLGDAFEPVEDDYVQAFRAAVERRRMQNALSRSGAHLKPYRVMLHENRGDTFKLAFDCDAADPDDAAEQAEGAYPGCEVISCTGYDCSVARSTG